ncbi:hephaestin-like protein isoform X1 [Mya arenaria]|uniref:hephaestin-like protein isoform X1 n=1 Tax=Mya arenaria TaxID=6604 RepID=UPI0022E1E336|nr:hephaestin-like protein isoform X1 [Mya arenaria]
MLLILRLCFALLLVARSRARIRHYFIAAVEVDWDYAPSGRNLVGPDTFTSRRLIENRDDQIGSVYRKVLYREFTDATFTEQIPVPDWMGFVGPTVKAEVGDSVIISFRNMASKGNFSVHPHGYFYDKRSEGARYLDGTSGADKLDDGIPPGGSYVYTWHVPERHAPTEDDDACVPWGYHGHTASPYDIATGLVGFALICKRGTLDLNGKRRDVDKEFVVYADIADESKSFFFEESIQKCGEPAACKARADAGDEDFGLSNEMHHINGYVYGNQPPFKMSPGDRAVFYVMSLNLASHIMRILGHTMIIKQRRTENALVNSASFLSANTVAAHPGHWLLYCRNLDHVIEGMLAFVDVENKPVLSNIAGLGRRLGKTRTYYLAIEEIIWDYAPGLTPDSSSSVFLQQGPNRIGSRYKKAVYRLYTDGTFTTPVIRGAEDIHMGFTGPPIKGEEGDVIVVVLYNKASREYSFLAGGVSMSKENEGAVYKQNVQEDTTPTGASVPPGTIRRYNFFVSSIDAPTKIDPDCLTYIYRSAVDLEKDFYSGLFGPMLICKHGKLDKAGKKRHREFFLNFLVVNENLSHYLTENINMFATSPATVDPEDEGFQLSNKIRAINGFTFGTLPGLNMCYGDQVTWHVYTLGPDIDNHHVTFEGNNFVFDGMNIDTVSVFPGMGHSVDMIPDQLGYNRLRCGQLGLEKEGMFAWYNVDSCYSRSRIGRLPKSGITRRYYIGALNVEWDYAPVKVHPITGKSLFTPTSPSYIFVRGGPDFVGSIYTKTVYREFTDSTFTKMKPQHVNLGIIGPYIRGNVGDTIEIHLKNMANFPLNIVPKNLPFADGSVISSALPTFQGTVGIYKYSIPERSGPKKDQPNCVGTIYTSRVDPLKDAHSGLIGPMVICKERTLNENGQRTDDINVEFATAYFIIDENLSHHSTSNFAQRAPGRVNVKDADFVESNQYYSINGLIYGNLIGLDMRIGQRSAWYVFGMGMEDDIHTVHFHGQLYIRNTELTFRGDVLEVFAGTYETVEMEAYNPGTWLYHCHVSTHVINGMETVYNVLP